MDLMRKLPRKAIALTGVAVLALLGLLILAIARGSYDVLLLGLIAFIGVLFAAFGDFIRGRRSGDRGTAELRRVAAAVARVENTVTSSPRMLDGSSERQIAETAARFDWLARRHEAEAERLDTFMNAVEATLARHQDEVVARLDALQARIDAARATEPNDPETTGQGR